MRNNFRNNSPKIKCSDCSSSNLKKRKNFSHGSGSKAKLSYVCKDCGSSNTQKENNRRSFRK